MVDHEGQYAEPNLGVKERAILTIKSLLMDTNADVYDRTDTVYQRMWHQMLEDQES